MASERLDKIIASMGIYSRKEVKQLIRERKICVDGNYKVKPEDKVDPDTARITVQGEPLNYSKYVYVMLNKPAGVLSATEDGTGRTVMDLLPQAYRSRGMFPVGRLDKDTEGLLLVTDDGQLAHELLSPVKHVEKEYYVCVQGALTQEDTDAFRDGVHLSDGYQCLSAELNILSAGTEQSEAMVTIREGKYHQIKRMFASRGKHVTYLKRVRMGSLQLDPALGFGEYRLLTESETEALQNRSREGASK